jgi:ABC-type bacteriocin/lantibiotic exporter with double-glycine peptidase domain
MLELWILAEQVLLCTRPQESASDRNELMKWWMVITGVVVSAWSTGCRTDQTLRRHPPGVLQVRYQSADDHAGCLTASVAMAANYVLGEYRLNEKQLRWDLAQAGLDPTRVEHVKRHLDQLGLHLVTLSGTMDEKPPLGLRYWILKKGYPTICVINTYGSDPAFNHAVVVVGFSKMGGGKSADTMGVYYLDPSSAEPLHKLPVSEFERFWGQSGHAMMVVVRPPGSPGGQTQ